MPNQNEAIETINRWLGCSRFGVAAYKTQRVLLTPHFSLGWLMPNAAVDFVVQRLRSWNVSLPSQQMGSESE